jgi:hypothetical protein
VSALTEIQLSFDASEHVLLIPSSDHFQQQLIAVIRIPGAVEYRDISDVSQEEGVGD